MNYNIIVDEFNAKEIEINCFLGCEHLDVKRIRKQQVKLADIVVIPT